jgi:signal transduction histidine kinase
VASQPSTPDAISSALAEAAHDLSNSLAAIDAFAQLVRDDAALPGELRASATLLCQETTGVRERLMPLLEAASRVERARSVPG